jgi:hypothetical protein
MPQVILPAGRLVPYCSRTKEARRLVLMSVAMDLVSSVLQQRHPTRAVL